MSIVLLDRAGGTAYSASSPLGQGSLLLSNSLTTYQSIANIGDTNQFYYLARHRTANEWEVGLGSVDASGAFPYLVRPAANVYDGSSGTGALVNFSAGYVDVISCYPAALLDNLAITIGVSSGFVVAVSDGVFTGRSLTGDTDVSVLNGTGVSGDVNFSLSETGVVQGTYGSATQIPVLDISNKGRVVSVSLATIDAITSIVASVSSYMGVAKTGTTASIYLDPTQLDSRYDAAGQAVSVQTVALAAVTSVQAVAAASIANTNAALTSVNSALGTSIGTTNSALTSVNTTLGAAITSINSAAALLAARNVFTSTNDFQGNISVSSAAFNGRVWVSAGSWNVPFQLTDATSIAVDMSKSNDFVVTLGGNRTMEAPTNLQPGQGGTIWLHQDGTGSRTLAWNSVWKFPASTAPTLSTPASTTDAIGYEVRTSGFITANCLKAFG